MAGSGGWVTSMRWAAYASRASCRLQSFVLAASEPSTSSRASETFSRTFDRLQSLQPSPELPAISGASCLLPPEPLTSFRASCRLQSFLPPPELPAVFRASQDCLQSFRPTLQLTAASRASCRFHSLQTLDLQSFLPSPELHNAASGAFDFVQTLRPP
jgi:hypothetical protein